MKRKKEWIVTERQVIEVTYYAPGKDETEARAWCDEHLDAGREEIISSEYTDTQEVPCSTK